MAGPREQSADTSLDDILSSIRRIVSDDLNGADQLRDKLEAAQATRSAQQEPAPPPSEVTQPVYSDAEHNQSAPMPVAALGPAPQPQVAETVNIDDTAALIAAARAAAGTPAREYVAAEPRLSQSEVTAPRESLAPFDRGIQRVEDVAQQPSELSDLGAPIVLPTEIEVNGQDLNAHVAEPVPMNGDHHGQNGHAVEPQGEPETMVSELDPAIQPPQAEIQTQEVPAQVPAEQQQSLNGAHEMNGARCESAPRTAMPEDDAEPLNLEVPAESAEEPAYDLPEVPQVEALNGHAAADTVASDATVPASGQAGLSSTTVLEQTVTRMLRPMLKDWLDENMPRLIEQALREDVLPQGDDSTA